MQFDFTKLVLISKISSNAGIRLRMGSANERRRDNVTSSFIGCAHTQNDLVRYDFMLYLSTNIYKSLFQDKCGYVICIAAVNSSALSECICLKGNKWNRSLASIYNMGIGEHPH